MLNTGIIIYALYFFGPLTDQYNLSVIRLSYVPIGLLFVSGFGIHNLILKKTFRYTTHTGALLISLFFISTILIVIKSLLVDKNLIGPFYSDLEVAILMLSGIVIGVDNANWRQIIKIYTIILALGIITNLISFTFLTSIAREVTETSIMNKMQAVLLPATFFILLYPFIHSKKRKNIYILSFIVLFIEQVFFQKRLPFFQLIIIILLLLFIVYKYNKPYGKNLSSILKKVLLFLLLFSTAGFLLILLGYNVQEAATGLFTRYTATGTVVQTTIDDGRFQLALDTLFNIIQHGYFMLGQGFGGVLTGGMLYWTVESSTSFQKFSAYTIEVGQIWPLWKGGILYWLLIAWIFLYGVSRFKKVKNNSLGLSCWAFILVTWLFLFGQEYWHSPLYIFLIGCCLGYLFRKEFNTDPATMKEL